VVKLSASYAYLPLPVVCLLNLYPLDQLQNLLSIRPQTNHICTYKPFYDAVSIHIT
jgi:hypothetical protein